MRQIRREGKENKKEQKGVQQRSGGMELDLVEMPKKHLKNRGSSIQF